MLRSKFSSGFHVFISHLRSYVLYIGLISDGRAFSVAREKKNPDRTAVHPRSLDLFYIVNYQITRGKTSLTDSTAVNGKENIGQNNYHYPSHVHIA